MASGSHRFRLTGPPVPATPLRNESLHILSTPTFSSYDFLRTPPTHSTPLRNTQTSYGSSSAARGSKRKRNQENLTPSDVLPVNIAAPPLKKKYTPRRTVEEKLEIMFEALQSVSWALAEFLYYVFRMKDELGKEVKRSTQHSMYATHFLQGRSVHTAAKILECWLKSSDGRAPTGSLDEGLMYSMTTVYTEIKPARVALTAFAAQIIGEKLVKEAKVAVKPANGLHATSKKRGTNKVEWADVGAATVSRVADVIKEHQPLTWNYFNKMAQGKQSGVHAIRARRPTETVCTHVIATLNFTRNNEARLLPLARGLLYFAYSAPADLMAYGSRIGDMPSYSTVYNALKGLAVHEATVTAAHANDPTKLGFLQFDNVQNYSRQRDHRIGRANKMNTGIAATYCELEDVDITAADLDEKRRLVSENRRAKVTIEELLGMIDHRHLDTVLSLHWLRILVNSIPELSKWQEHVSMLFREKAGRLKLPVKPTKVHPLASSGKNETITTELKDALFDFFAQMGQKDGEYLRRKIMAGGDGLTFQKMLEIQRYLQFHSDPFQSLELLEPILSTWHTEWTDISRIFETHWDALLSPDPSSLGHSAAQINRSEPTSLKKVDYYPAVELMYLVVEVRILDCWRNHFKCDDIFEYFTKQSDLGSLPEIEDLIDAAQKLHRAFSSTRGLYHALGDTTAETEWAKTVPLGTTWSPPPDIQTSQRQCSTKGPTKSSKTKTKPASRNPCGDRVLANSINFMRDALVSREMSYAIAEGDVGRVYEVMKVLLFTFAGSTHAKYASYLLETICRLELESTQALKDAILKTTLVNLSGRAGCFSAADFMQEFFNRLLEAIVEKKGVDYGDSFIREVISRNLHHFARIKLDLRLGVGLLKRSGHHTAPHLRPEIRTLLKVYRDHELHFRRPGRAYQDVDKDNFQMGVEKLRKGKLKKWLINTTSSRGFLSQDQKSPPLLNNKFKSRSNSDSESDSESDPDSEPDDTTQTLGYAEVINGELVLEHIDIDVDELFSNLENSTNPMAKEAKEVSESGDEGNGSDSDVMDVE